MSTGNGFDSNFKEQLANALQELLGKIDDVLEDYEDNDEYEADEDDDEYEYDEVEEDDDIIETRAFEYDRNVFVVLGRALKFKSEYDSNGDLTRVLIGFGNQTPDLDDDDTVSMVAVYPKTAEEAQNWPKDLTAWINMMLRDGDSVYFLNEEHTEAFFTTHKRGSINDETTILERVHFAVMEGRYIFELTANAYCMMHARNCGTTVDDHAFGPNIERLISIMESIRLEGAPFRFVQPDVDLIKKKLFLNVSFNDWIDYAENPGEALYNNVPESFEGNTVHQYSDTITFDLSNRYYMYYVVFSNCVRKMRFVYRKQERANFYTFVEEITDEELRNLDALHRRYRENEKDYRIDTYGYGDTEHKVSLYAGKMLADDDEGFRGLCINIVLGHRVLRISDVYAARSDENTTPELFDEIINCVKEIAFSMRINGKPIKIPRFDFSDISKPVCRTMVLENGEKDVGPWAEVPPTYTVKRGNISAKVWNNGVDPSEIDDEQEDNDSGLYDVSFDEQGMSGRYRHLTYYGEPNPIIEGIMRDYYKTEDEILYGFERDNRAKLRFEAKNEHEDEEIEEPNEKVDYSNIFFGAYPQTASGELAPIEWRVLDRCGDKTMLISEKVIEESRFSRPWPDSDLRKWLNEDFVFEAFTEEEKKHILTTKVKCCVNPLFDEHFYDETEDQVFLPGISTVLGYLSGDGAAICRASDYAAAKDIGETGQGCYWWTSTFGRVTRNIVGVRPDGTFSLQGFMIDYIKMGVRPCIQLELTEEELKKRSEKPASVRREDYGFEKLIEKKKEEERRRRAEQEAREALMRQKQESYEHAAGLMKQGGAFFAEAGVLLASLDYLDSAALSADCQLQFARWQFDEKCKADKQAQEAELRDAESKLAPVQKQATELKAALTQKQNEKAELEKKISVLRDELAAIRGLFKGKQKQEVQAAINVKLEQMATVDVQISSLQTQFEPVQTTLADLQTERDKISAKLKSKPIFNGKPASIDEMKKYIEKAGK